MATKSKKSLKIYKTPFFRRRWFYILTASFFTLLIIGFIVLFLILAGPKKRADEKYDPAALSTIEIPSTILDRNGKEYSRIFVQDRRPIKIEDVPLHFIDALVAAEDGRFHEHNGVDYKGVLRAVLLNLKAGRTTQGASTITQQLARQSFDLTEKSLKRKLVEAFLARRIEREFSKDEILEFYLNRIYFGSGYWGINAAALGYFGKPITEVDVVEAATLCGLIKSPNRLSPIRNREGARRSRNNVLLRMKTEDMISEADYERLKALPLVTAKERAGRKIGYVYEEIRQQVNELIPFEKTASSGYKIYTTVDTTLQSVAEETLKRHLDEAERNPAYVEGAGNGKTNQTYEQYVASLPTEKGVRAPTPKYLQGSVLVVDNHTGGVIAMVGGRDFTHSVFNRVSLSKRSPGSAFLPLLYTAAFERDFFPGSPLKDRELDNRGVGIGGASGILGEWGTESSVNAWEGIIPARDALVKSKMSASARLGDKVGLTKVKNLAKRAGIKSKLADLPRTYLGETGMKLDEVVMAYTMFPNSGMRPKELFMIEKIEDAKGKVIYRRQVEEPVRVVDEITAFQTHSCLKEVLTRGTGSGAFDGLGLLDLTAAGKTGTAYNFRDLWFVGYNSEITCGMWAGFDTPKTIYRGAFSNEILLPAWVDVMNASLDKFTPTEIPMPDDAITVEVCRRSGMRATDSCYEKVETEGELLGGFDPGERYERSTYKEIIRRGIKFNNYCDVHSDNPEIYVSSPLLPELLQEEQAGNNVIQPGANAIAAVIPKAPTIIGIDPYNSLKPEVKKKREGPSVTAPSAPRAARAVIRIGSGAAPVELKAPAPIEFPELD